MNKVLLVGNLVRDPEVRTTSTGKQISNFTVAVNESYSKNQTTNFIRCVAWNATADYVSLYYNKGDKIAVEGKIVSRSYLDNNGKTVYVTEVVVDQIEGLSRRKNTDEKNLVNIDAAIESYSSVNTNAAFTPFESKRNLENDQILKPNAADDEEDDWLDFNEIE